MNPEKIFAHRVTAALDQSAERLPWRVAQRLERARQVALARMPAELAAQTAGVLATAGGPVLRTGPGWPWRALAAVVPPLAVAAGLYGIVVWTDTRDAEETAEVDAAVLTDELPISAYADQGFGVYLNNTTSRP